MLTGLPKIALRKSGTKTLKNFAGRGWIKFFSRYVIPEDSYRGSTDKEYGFPIKPVLERLYRVA